jgi:hypothetical protein
MRTSRREAHLAVALVAVGVCSVSLPAASPTSAEIETLLLRVGQRVVEYYRRAQHVVCIERSTVQPILSNWSPDGPARSVESELRVDFDAVDGDALPEARVTREIRHINGRLPRDRDKKDRAGCTDPNPLSPEPLAFLLPAHRDDYRFISVQEGREKDRPALVIDFMTTVQASRPELIEDERGHDDCFDWRGPIATRGRVWVDAATYDVLRVDRRFSGPVDVRVPWRLQTRYLLPSWITLDREDVTMRFTPVTFTDPDEILVLPESIVTMTIARNSLQSVRRTETFSDYRRFVTAGRVVTER